MLRFVLLRHECPADYRDGPHWDLMVERPDTQEEHRLATWSLLELPEAFGGEATGPIVVTPLPDHRAHYLEYEGPVAGGRGEVRRVVSGHVDWTKKTPKKIEIRLTNGDSVLSKLPFCITLATCRKSKGEWHLTWELAPPEGEASRPGPLTE